MSVESIRLLRGRELEAVVGGDVLTIAAEMHGPVSAAVLQQAGLRLQRRYPGLRARCANHPKGSASLVLEFCEADREQLQYKEVWSDAGLPANDAPVWHRVIEQQVNQPFDVSAGFMFRICWVPNKHEGGHILVSASPIVTDETSLRNLVQALFHESARLGQSPVFPRYDSSALNTQAAPPALLDIAPLSAQERIVAKLARLTASANSTDGPGTSCAKRQHDEAAETKCYFAVGSVENCHQVLATAARRGVALRYIVGAAAQFVLADRFTQKSKCFPWSTNSALMMEFDLRETLGGRIALEQLGMIQGAIEVTSSLTEGTTLWQLAGTLQRCARSQLQRGATRSSHVRYERADTWPQMRRRGRTGPVDLERGGPLIRIGCVADFGLSNRYGPLSITRLFVARSHNSQSTPFEIWINILDERLHYSAASLARYSSSVLGGDFLAQTAELVENSHQSCVSELPLRKYVYGRLRTG